MNGQSPIPRNAPPSPTTASRKTSPTLPRNDQAEEIIIGVAIKFPQIIPALMDVLPINALYSVQKQILLKAMYDLVSRGETPNVVTICERLSRQKELNAALPKGTAILMDWVDNVTSSAGLKGCVRIVLEYWIGREMIHLTRKLHEQSWDIAADYPKALAAMRDLALDLVEKTRILDRLIASEDLR